VQNVTVEHEHELELRATPEAPKGDDPQSQRSFALDATVVGRISPEGKQAIVKALREEGRYVAMVGDGVNDVPALKSSRLAIAQGSGAQMARSVSDLVLISGDFASVPKLVEEGRRALRNLQRVTKLYVTKSAFAAFLILTMAGVYVVAPLLPGNAPLLPADSARPGMIVTAVLASASAIAALALSGYSLRLAPAGEDGGV
jgi:cation transport ATPase